MSDPLLGRVLADKFVIEKLLGSGSMGAVYRARQVALDKVVAVKVMHAGNAADRTFVSRFEREARAASRLDHPNSTRVIDFGCEPDGLLYLVMEYLDGTPLSALIERCGALGRDEVVSIVVQILAALGVAHDMGVVHRDMKPDNVMLLEGHDDEGAPRLMVKVCDFGVAALLSEATARGARASGKAPAAKLTSHGLMIGTPHYMSPEQARGDVVDLRSDLYAVGIVMYELLAGRVPFDGGSLLDVVIKQVTEAPEPPSTYHPGCDAGLQAICMKAISKHPGDRYQSAREMRAAVRNATGWLEDPTRPSLFQVPGSPSPSPRPVAVLAVRAASPPLAAPASAASGLADASPAARAPAGDSAPPSSEGELSGGASSVPGALHRRSSRAPSPRALRLGGWSLLGAAALGALGLGLFSAPSLRRRPLDAPVAVAAASAERGPMPPRAWPAPEPTDTDAASARPPAVEMVPRAASAGTAAPSPRPSVGRALVSAPSGARVPPKAPADAPPETGIPEAIPAPPAPPAGTAEVPAPPVAPVPPPAPTVAPAPPFDAGRARVDWAVGAVSGGSNAGNMRRALAPVSGAWSACFQSALRAAGRAVSGAGVLHLRTDETGHVVSATVTGFDSLPSVGACIAARSYVTVPEVDTGDVSATVSLTFRAE